MIKALLPHVLRLAKELSVVITFVDVGSRNGALEFRELAPFVEAYGFEPNPSEYEKLLTGRTDHFLKHGFGSPAYRKLSYFPYALGNACGRHEFYVTPSPGACGLLEPNLSRLREIVWKGRTLRKSLGDDDLADFKKIEVEVKTLETIAADQELGRIDYLKIDVEGFEYEVLEGARAILPRTGVIKVETGFIPYRKGQKLFSHVDLLLRDVGFDVLKHEVVQEQIGYKVRTTPIEFIPASGGGRFVDPYGQPLLCDAIYVNRALEDPVGLVAQAIVLMEKNYLDEALHILRTKTAVSAPRLFELLETARNGGLGQQLRMLGYRAVDALVDSPARLWHRLRPRDG